MSMLPARLVRVALTLIVFGGLYLLALHSHAEREQVRQAAVDVTPGCKEKLQRYALAADARYRSPYVHEKTGAWKTVNGYSEDDIRAIQRGCNIVDDMQGQLAKDAARERWNAARFVRSTHSSCDHCHQGLGDKQDPAGNRPVGSNGLAASWVMADMYDRFTGLILPYEMRQMQCYINSSNGFKPNAADDLIRDVTAYSRFLSAALDLRIAVRYPEQGVDEIPASMTRKHGDDYVRGAALYQQKCARCHGPQGLGTEIDGKVIFPAVAGPNSYTLQSRNHFSVVSSVLPGFICRNMPLGEEGSLDNQQCRDIASYISTLPRAAGDRQGPLVAAWQRLMMAVMPPLTQYADSLASEETRLSNGR